MTMITVTHVETGEVVRQLGPYPDARAARVAAGETAGQPLTWQRDLETWRAEKYPLAYHVAADVADEEISHG
ncbi:hypothetical protein [Deinococcus multiflagellatus]|uniref:hypothetical protein n=1 Tax=Deinococcus multiflagellatus TaxID=1656887 RepID=UPI001CD01936|nr:hypothetical protein [Deinococcus multiflagellatus]MBZ9715380.1 hypothetical protein [Deinococcus multiflagellatus]